ncbi:MAG: CDP-diacylglycerol--serine O-phosphatidyltransferase [Coxiellaceae bacterium]|nr:CDP-diacylglycerol--serine O-phosphatidyltransferase [Coxiellaceae bacterium]
MSEQKSHSKRFRRGIYLLPNLFTMGAMFAGFYAIIMATSAHFVKASVAILVAIVLDGLDGRVARMTRTQSEFGAQLDSLSDMVSFGIAPAITMYVWSLYALGKLGWCVAFIFAVCGALRLARFNSESSANKRFFYGLAIPLPAGLIASAIWLCHDYQVTGAWIPYLLAFVALILGFLEVSVIRYRSFKDLDVEGKVPFQWIVFIVLVLVFIVYNPPVVIFIMSCLYACSAPAHWVWKRCFNKKTTR